MTTEEKELISHIKLECVRGIIYTDDEKLLKMIIDAYRSGKTHMRGLKHGKTTETENQI